MPIIYACEPALTSHEFRAVLIASTLAQRRPVSDLERLGRMLLNADIVMTARDRDLLVGVARSVTDFAYCCYLSDLAVDVAYQRQGIGRKLIAETHAQAGSSTTLMLVAAPTSESYYAHIGMAHVSGCYAARRST